MLTSNQGAQDLTTTKGGAIEVHASDTMGPGAPSTGVDVNINDGTTTTSGGREPSTNGDLAPCDAHNGTTTHTHGNNINKPPLGVVCGDTPANEDNVTKEGDSRSEDDTMKHHKTVTGEHAVAENNTVMEASAATEGMAAGEGDIAFGEDSSNDTLPVVDPLCKAQPNCVAQSGDHRKVVSHVFGRNKRCTRKLPDNAWIMWCRKHYQRKRYRAEDDGIWHIRQLALVREQLDEFERLANVESWHVVLRKGEQALLDAENARLAATVGQAAITSAFANVPGSTNTAITAGPDSSTADSADVNVTANPGVTDAPSGPATTDAEIKAEDTFDTPSNTAPNSPPRNVNPFNTSESQETEAKHENDADSNNEDQGPAIPANPPPLWERFLVPHLGPTRTYTQVRTTLNRIDAEFRTPAFLSRENKEKVFPGVEFLPNFPGQQARPSLTKTSTAGGSGGDGGSKKRKSMGDDAAGTKRRRSLRSAGGGGGVV